MRSLLLARSPGEMLGILTAPPIATSQQVGIVLWPLPNFCSSSRPCHPPIPGAAGAELRGLCCKK